MAKKKGENGLTTKQEVVLKLVRVGGKVTAKQLVGRSQAKPPYLIGNVPAAMHYLRRLTEAGKFSVVEGGGRGREVTFKRVA